MKSSTVVFAKVVLACLLGLATFVPGGARPLQKSATSAWQSSDGRKLDPFQIAKSQPVVLIFVLSDCPLANKFAPEINRIIDEYEPKGVTLKIVYVDVGITPDHAKQHAVDFGYKSPALLDPKRSLAKRVEVTVSPEAVVLGRKGEILYRGRIDDRAADLGKMRPKPTRADLRLAIDAVLKGQKIAVPRTKAIGCIL